MDDASSSQSRPTDLEMDEVHVVAPVDTESATANLLPGGATSSDRVRKAVRKTNAILRVLRKTGEARSHDPASYRKAKSPGSHREPPQQHEQLNSVFEPASTERDGTKEGCGGWNPIKLMWRSVSSDKIWRYILYGKKDSGSEAEHDKDYPRSDALCALLFILITVTAITTVLCLQLKSWPQATQIYYTDDPQDNQRGGLIYTCGCSLPPSLQSPENPPESTNLRICYDRSIVEDVTIFMFSDSNEGTSVSSIVQSESVTPIQKIFGGFTLTQEYHELTVHNETAYRNVISQELGVKPLPAIYPSIDYLLSPNFNYFSNEYTHMSLFYDCTDCDLCSLEKANNLSGAIAPGIIVSCYYYADLERCNTSSRNYTAKCVLYPSGKFPAIFGIKGFLDQLLKLTGVTNIRGELKEYHSATAMHSDALYIKIRDYTESNITWNFVEAQKGSLLSMTLLPKFGTDCSSLPTTVPVCNDIWVCSFFQDDYCFYNYCNLPEGMVSPENLPDKTQQTLCKGRSPSGTCNMTSALKLVEKEESPHDALSSFLDSHFSDAILYNNNTNNGLCLKTYQNVIRYDPSGQVPTPQGQQQQEQPDTMFLEANCTFPKPQTYAYANANTTNRPWASLYINTTNTQSPFCWTTGRFHYLSDLPEDDWSQLPDILYQAKANRFVCYRVGPQKFVTWFINAFGILFGWIGTIQLVFYAAFAWLFVPARKRMYRRFNDCK